MKAYVAVTDNDWFRFLRDRSPLDEVNFWQPGGSRLFKTLSIGQPFLFKLHYPENFIAGGGFFAHASLLDSHMAWDAFGEKNGAASFEEMRLRIVKYRRTSPDPHQDYTIGCIILQEPFFFDEHNWIQVPKDFGKNIVQGKSYNLGSSPGRDLWEAVLLRLHALKRERV
ncbi:MAG: HNH endonuclease, partial [Candidatus Binatia bacterium]